MAKLPIDGIENSTGIQANTNQDALRLDANSADTLTIGDSNFLADATMTKEGFDLHLTSDHGQPIIIENYFLSEPQPTLKSTEGNQLSPKLVNSFLKNSDDDKFASTETQNDESAVGVITEANGEAIITRTDGTQHVAEKGMYIFQGDIVETEFDAAVNITFADESTFSVGEDARMTIDEFIFDPATNDGSTNVSILRGVFMYTSGLIGRDNPDSVEIDTPAGSIGIRGTIIGGKIMDPNTGECQITVIEGAIVVYNSTGEQILSSQFETVTMMGHESPIKNVGQLNSQQLNNDYGSVRSVSGNLFSSIDDSGNKNNETQDNNQQQKTQENRQEASNADENAKQKGDPETPKDGENTAEGTEEQTESKENQAEEQGTDAEPSENNQDPNTDQSYNQDSDFKQALKANTKTAPKNNYEYKHQNNESQSTDSTAHNGESDSSYNNPLNWDKAPEIRVKQWFSNVENDNGAQLIATLDIWDPNAGDIIDLSRIRIGGIQNAPNAPMQIVWDSTANEYQLIKNSGYTFNFEDVNNGNTVNVRIWDDNTSNWNDYGIPFQILDANDTPTNITLKDPSQTSSFSSMDENLAANTVVAILNTQDEDSGDTFSYALDASADASKFTIDGNQIKLNQALSYEDQSSYSFNVTVTDSAGASYTKNITLNLNDVVEAPEDITINDDHHFEDFSGTIYNASATVAVLGAVLGKLDVDDPEGDTFSQGDFTIEHPTNNASFPMGSYIEISPVTNGYILKLKDDVLIRKINATDYIFVKNGTDASFTLPPDGNGFVAIDFNVTVSDTNAGASYSEDFKLSVQDNLIHLIQLNGLDGFKIENDARNIGTTDPEAYFGRSVTVGDFNGDGALDIVSGAPGAINGQTENSGGFYVLKGNATDPRDVNHSGDNTGDRLIKLDQIVTNTTVGFFNELTTAADDSNSEFADKIVNLGDVNGDGLDDLLVTAPGENKAYIHFGSTGGANPVVPLINLPAATINEITVTSVGDVNGDGFNDVLFGSPNFSGSSIDSGVFNLFFGEADLHLETNIDYTSPPANVTNFEFEGSTAGDHLGTSLAGIGDFNGDGYDDFIVGAAGHSSDKGQAQLYFGGPSSAALQTVFTGPATGSRFGENIAGLGDINGDGYDDFIISAPNRSDSGTGNMGVGEAYVVYGNSGPGSTEDIDTYVSTATNGFTIRYGSGGSGGGDEHLGTTMSSAGDFNGDGYDDFIVTGVNGEMIDAAYLIYGGSVLNGYLTTNGNVFELHDIHDDGTLGMVLQYSADLDEDGDNTQDQILSVSAAGDINQDGFDDIIMGAESVKDGMGQTYVIYGRSAQDDVEHFSGTSRVDAAVGLNYIGNHEDNYLYDNGITDLRVDSAFGDDKIKISNDDFDFIDGGSGFDELRLYFSGDETSTASADVIDLRGVEQNFKNIEEFFIDSGTNGGLDELHINISDVLDLLHQSENGNILFSTDQTGGGRNNIVKFYNQIGSNQTLNALGFTDDADGDLTQDTTVIGTDTYYKYTLTGTDYTVLLDSQLGDAAAGGSV